jgi:hypothetical protein
MIVRGPDVAIHSAIATQRTKSSRVPIRAAQVARPASEILRGFFQFVGMRLGTAYKPAAMN